MTLPLHSPSAARSSVALAALYAVAARAAPPRLARAAPPRGATAEVAAVPGLTLLASRGPWVLPFDLPSAAFTELPPPLVKLPPSADPACYASPGPALGMYLSTAYSALCVSNATALPLPTSTLPVGFAVSAATCAITTSGESQRAWPPTDVPPHSEWYRNYDGVMGAVPIATAVGGTGTASAAPASLFLVRHGEHKNELWWGTNTLYQGTINPEVRAEDCFSGFHNGTFADCEPSYNAFVSGMLLPSTAPHCFGVGVVANESSVDLGPLAWPLAGYKNATGGKASYGVRQPSAISGYDGTLFVTWVDSGFNTSEAWVAASPPGPRQGLPGTFFTYNARTRAWDVPTLPPAFDPLAAPLFWSAPAPAASEPGAGPTFNLGAEGSGAIRLAGARLSANGTSTGLYLAVYTTVNYTRCYGVDGRAGGGAGGGTEALRAVLRRRWRPGPPAPAPCYPTFQVFLRVTPDWAAWGPPLELAAFEAPGWDAAHLQYATLLAADGATTDVVDAAEFYILATCGTSAAPCNATYGPVVTTAFVSVALS